MVQITRIHTASAVLQQTVMLKSGKLFVVCYDPLLRWCSVLHKKSRQRSLHPPTAAIQSAGISSPAGRQDPLVARHDGHVTLGCIPASRTFLTALMIAAGKHGKLRKHLLRCWQAAGAVSSHMHSIVRCRYAPGLVRLAGEVSEEQLKRHPPCPVVDAELVHMVLRLQSSCHGF